MNWNYRKPIFTDITPLTAVDPQSPAFTITWTFPIDLNDISTHDPSDVLYYELFRHIENKVSISANGGIYNNPEASIFQSNFKFVTTLNKNLTTYTDLLTDLSMHSDEGISLVGGKWLDSDGKDVVEEIRTTKRRLYYKLLAKTSNVGFNTTPFIYIAHTNGIECRSLITQVHNNVFYNEGDIVWFNGDLGNINRIAVDPVYDSLANRKGNVWGAGNNRVYCLDKSTGQIIHNITATGLGEITGLKLDPDTGDAIYVGNKTNVYRVSAINGLVSIVNTVPNATNNNGISISKENGTHFAYTINNYDTISKLGLDSNTKVTYPRTRFGCTSATKSSPTPPNILGITTGTDQGIWVNGHTPIHYQYNYSSTSCSTSYAWVYPCLGGSIDQSYANDWNNNHAWAINAGLLGTARCEQNKPGNGHYVATTTCNTIQVTYDTNFLQDIGYIYGVTDGVNANASNGDTTYTPYTYPTGYSHYSPFTLSANRGGWVGSSPVGTELGKGRPFVGQLTVPPAPDPSLSPEPALSQKGLATTYPSHGVLSGSNYDIYQVNETENKVHRLGWNGTTVSYNTVTPIASTDYWNITNPVHCSVDSQNNVWVIQEGASNPSELTVIYNLTNTTDFASGGNCAYPVIQSPDNFITQHYEYGANGNNEYIEYYLTRATTFTPTITSHVSGLPYLSSYGSMLTGTNAQQITTAKNWVTTGSNYTSIGKNVYPNYSGYRQTKSFSRVIATDTKEYNSDNTGTLMLYNLQEAETDPAFIRPATTYPQVILNVVNPESASINCDGTFWNDLNKQDTQFTKVSGYDDLKVLLSATMVTSGSFFIDNYSFVYNDKTQDIGGNTNTISTYTTNNTISYTYHDPSLNGKPFNRTAQYPAETTGKYTPYSLLEFDPSCYLLEGDTMVSSVSSNTVDVTVFERWPTARFYVTPIDTSVIRHNILTSWNVGTASAYPVSDNGLSKFDQKRIVYGYDPLSAQFNDMSITRTWPMSSWYWTYGDKPTYLGFTLPDTIYAHVTSAIITGSPASSVKDDCVSERKDMVDHLYKGPGTYYATLWVKASNTGTDSWNISSGVTDELTMNNNFVISAVREIHVLEVCPKTEFSIISGETVPNTFSDDVGITTINNATVTTNLISGYAPHLKVKFVGSLTGRSLPLSAAQWDYSDYYVNPLPSDVTYYTPPAVGWPIWNTETYLTTGIHTFVMPGLYNITLRPIVSAYDGYVSNCVDGLRKDMLVYVKEILPVCNITVDVPALSSPVTVTVNPSATDTGSFPICRIDYNFSDGSDPITISRIMSSEYVNYVNTSAYADLADPRNILVSHTYNRTTNYQADTYTISAIAYACNTNSYNVDTFDVGPITLPTFSDTVGNVHLIENRMYNGNNDLLLVFEGDKSLNNYTILLSTGNI